MPLRATGAPHSLTLGDLKAVSHGFFGCAGGVSEGPYASLNIDDGLNDDKASVTENRSRLLSALDVPQASLIHLTQVHGTEVVSAPQGTHKADAMWSSRTGCALMIKTADCIPILLASTDGQVVGAAHAGWRGTAARIGERLVASVAREAGIGPQNLVVELGPGIGPCCFGVGRDVLLALDKAFDEKTCRRAIRSTSRGRFVDLWALNQASLVEAGVLPQNLSGVRQCTACSPGAFFSYRRQGGLCGRQGAAVVRRV